MFCNQRITTRAAQHEKKPLLHVSTLDYFRFILKKYLLLVGPVSSMLFGKREKGIVDRYFSRSQSCYIYAASIRRRRHMGTERKIVTFLYREREITYRPIIALISCGK